MLKQKTKIKTQTLHNFQWRGINNTGKKVSGKLLALTEIEVRAKLNEQSIQIKKIKKRRISSLEKMKHTVKRKDITLFTRQLATMLSAGVPIVQSLQLIAENNIKAEMKSILNQVCLSIEAGTQLSKALATSCSHFDSFYIDLVATGEETGSLSHAFSRLAEYREKSEALRAKVVKAMIYPTMVFSIAIAVTVLMLVFVIPEFEAIFKGFGAALPWFTQQVVNASHFLQNYGFWIILTLLLLTASLRLLSKKSYAFRRFINRHCLQIPIIGPVLSKAAIAKFSRTLATSFSSGLPILHSLQTTSKTAGNLYYQEAIQSVQQNTAAGMPLYLAMRHTQAFPEMVLQMVMIGEESGKLDDMLNKVAFVYEDDVDNTVDNLGKILEPFIILFLGIMIGGLVVSMYLPIFNLMSVIG
ncbi:type II secretion system F family protein [Aliivibrio finisterrensis]|uniref:Type II secretion system F family protein n=1 Tax=Aliivibrio finisterrensis TaxID=511998 RepID=A0A4V1Z7K5_9GAMM|nr:MULTISPECIES: type II secretion system F family protein [Aliivibrio]MDD9175615.1 type II secretion system F family protein [Aliivibrio sp. S3TY1]MDD9192811.1 type II secretion system F family protein [Aliivibrio sp. S2TY2]RYU45643.1 type II secretion system F family protein [Aliivibrio finisterrensis]